ncbi:unnamed protein product [Penicillium pancosmium]
MNEARLRRVATEPLEANSIPSIYQATQQVLWIGCSDSNTRESNVLNLLGNELLVLRNIGNMIIDGDLSSETAVRHAVVDLQVATDLEHVHSWFVLTMYSKLNSLYAAHEEEINRVPVVDRDRYFVELNVLDQMRSLCKYTEVTDATKKGHLQLHGLVYDTNAEKAYRVLEV